MSGKASILVGVNGTYRYLINLALPLIEWVDYRMRDERQRAIYTDSGYPFSLVYVPLETRGYLPLFRSEMKITPS